MRFAMYMAVAVAGAATIALTAAADALEGPGGSGGSRSTVSPYPGRPVPGRPIPTRPSPYNSVPTVKRPAIEPRDGSASKDIAPKPPPFERSYGGTSRTAAECDGIAQRALDSNDEKLWARYRSCIDMTVD